MGLENDEDQDIELELNANLEKVKNLIIQQRLSKVQLIHMCATYIILADIFKNENKVFYELIDDYHNKLKQTLGVLKRGNEEGKKLIDYLRHELPIKQAELIEKVKVITKRNQHISAAKHAANSLHNKPGGSRYKQDKIREIWACGKYSSRDICAEQECAALNMSFSSARKALRNTPDHA